LEDPPPIPGKLKKGFITLNPLEPSFDPAGALVGRMSDKREFAIAVIEPPAKSEEVVPPPPVPPIVNNPIVGKAIFVPPAPVCTPPAVPTCPTVEFHIPSPANGFAVIADTVPAPPPPPAPVPVPEEAPPPDAAVETRMVLRAAVLIGTKEI
jgi:hypothetical protein